jgi:hypothetical protein
MGIVYSLAIVVNKIMDIGLRLLLSINLVNQVFNTILRTEERPSYDSQRQTRHYRSRSVRYMLSRLRLLCLLIVD